MKYQGITQIQASSPDHSDRHAVFLPSPSKSKMHVKRRGKKNFKINGLPSLFRGCAVLYNLMTFAEVYNLIEQSPFSILRVGVAFLGFNINYSSYETSSYNTDTGE